MICPVEIVSDLSASRAARASAFPRRTDGCLPLRRGASLYINSLLSAFGEVAGHLPLAVFLQQRGHGFDHAGSALEVGLVLDDHVLAAQGVGNLGGVSCAFSRRDSILPRGARAASSALFHCSFDTFPRIALAAWNQLSAYWPESTSASHCTEASVAAFSFSSAE